MKFKMTLKNLIIIFSLLLSFVNKSAQNHNIKKRALPFPESSTVGLLAAIAIPLNLPDREVFFSYNFEANYNSPAPSNWNSFKDWTKYGIARSSSQGSNDTVVVKSAKKDKIKKPKKAKPKRKQKRDKMEFLSRKHVYTIFESKLNAMGFNGRQCMLKTICQIGDIGYNNGVLGDIVHIIFSPSTSRHDGISIEYYEAEELGRSGDNCNRYNSDCRKSILEYISIWK